MEELLWQIEGTASCTHHTPEQLRLPFHTAWWATNTGLDEQSCKCTLATVTWMPVYLTLPTGHQDCEQTQSCLASKG